MFLNKIFKRKKESVKTEELEETNYRYIRVPFCEIHNPYLVSALLKSMYLNRIGVKGKLNEREINKIWNEEPSFLKDYIDIMYEDAKEPAEIPAALFKMSNQIDFRKDIDIKYKTKEVTTKWKMN